MQFNIDIISINITLISLKKNTSIALAGLTIFALPLFSIADPAEISGGGNFTVSSAPSSAKSQFTALSETGAQAIRINVYPYSYYDGQKPLPEKMDQQVLETYRAGVKTIVLLFEFDGSYPKHSDAPNQLGDYEKWHSLGQAYASRFSPNSAWLKSQGISDWGITIFQAFNEPDGPAPADALPITGPSSYVTSLKGLADGVHSIDPALAVIPGGFMPENAFSDHTLRGYGPALAPSLNDGTLDGIDLHTYNDIQYAPIVGADGAVVFNFSPQGAFDAVKKACHITRDINFYTTEYNFKAHEQGITEELAAKRLLTCIWANLGVVKNDAKTPATRLALIWNLFTDAKQDPPDGLAVRLSPWIPSARARTFQLIMSLTKGMTLIFSDPKGRGEFILEGAGRKLWVWQNYEHWTDVPDSTFTINDIPEGTTKLEVIGWDGLRKSIPLSGQHSYTVTDLKPNETFMFLAVSEKK